VPAVTDVFRPHAVHIRSPAPVRQYSSAPQAGQTKPSFHRSPLQILQTRPVIRKPGQQNLEGARIVNPHNGMLRLKAGHIHGLLQASRYATHVFA
jgi:hypothetical protein